MFGLLNFLGNVISDVVQSNNKRDVDIVTDNNRTRVEISKIVLGGVALVGTLALQWKCSKTQSPPENFDNNNLIDESEEKLL